MRMWMVAPRILCKKHLLGEHVELHMLAGAVKKGRSLRGFFDKGLLDPMVAEARHTELVEEMLLRGYMHDSPWPEDFVPSPGALMPQAQAVKELIDRCEDCHIRYVTYVHDYDNLVMVDRIFVRSCISCETFRADGLVMFPRHVPNGYCRSGSLPHCTCDSCF